MGGTGSSRSCSLLPRSRTRCMHGSRTHHYHCHRLRAGGAGHEQGLAIADPPATRSSRCLASGRIG
eukprot:2915504-Rhodomonas_salina.1